MGLFDKKYCDICGEKIGLLGNRKLEDGNLCKHCAAKLSPFFNDRRNSTVDEIKAQLAYREENKNEVAAFHPTKVIGGDMKLYFDEDNRKWFASDARSWKDDNPDVMTFSQVTGCELDIEENRDEIMREDAEGNEVSYVPPRYRYSYDFYITITVNSPWFNEIRFQLNGHEIESRGSIAYREMQSKATEIKELFTSVREAEREAVAAANAPKTAVVCGACGATTMPDASGCCEYCGSPIA